MAKIITLLLSFALSCYCLSQTPVSNKAAKLDSLFAALAKNNMSMGAISIYKNGIPFYEKHYGITAIKNGTQITANNQSLYRIGSVTKMLTASIIMKLVEEGQLSLTQTIESFFPSLNGAATTTIHQLLAHKSMLPLFVRADDLEKLDASKTEADLVAVVNKAKAIDDTLQVRYNNLNYILLGLIAEKKYGKPYNQVLSTFLQPIGSPVMYGTYAYLDAAKNEANSFHLEDDKWVEDYEELQSPVSDGSGFLVTRPGTLNQFMIALFSERLINKEMLAMMLPQKEMFGLGLMKTNFGNHKGFGHTGRIEGFTGTTTYFPDDKVSISFVQNGSVYPMNDIMILVGQIMFDEPYQLPALQKKELTNVQLNRLMGEYRNDEEGYKVLVDRHKGLLRLRLAKGNGLLNKMLLQTIALTDSRLFNPRQGIFFDFGNETSGVYKTCTMKVNGAKLILKKS